MFINYPFTAAAFQGPVYFSQCSDSTLMMYIASSLGRSGYFAAIDADVPLVFKQIACGIIDTRNAASPVYRFHAVEFFMVECAGASAVMAVTRSWNERTPEASTSADVVRVNDLPSFLGSFTVFEEVTRVVRASVS